MTNSIQQSSSTEGNACSDTHEIGRVLWIPEVNCCVRKILLLLYMLSLFAPADTIQFFLILSFRICLDFSMGKFHESKLPTSPPNLRMRPGYSKEIHVCSYKCF
jgi:hypothetical protein